MSRIDGEDASLGFESHLSRSHPVVARSNRNENLIFSIPSSSDEDDDEEEDIATLRPSPMLRRSGLDDETIDAQHATQEVIGPSPWSPLTASPFTPNVAIDGNKGRTSGRSSFAKRSASPRRPGLKLSKAPPSHNPPDGSFSAKAMADACRVTEVVVAPRRRSSPRRHTVPSVLEAVASHPSPPVPQTSHTTQEEATQKKREAVWMDQRGTDKECNADPAPPTKKMKPSMDRLDEKEPTKRDDQPTKPSKKAADKPAESVSTDIAKKAAPKSTSTKPVKTTDKKSTEVKDNATVLSKQPKKGSKKKPTGDKEGEPLPSKTANEMQNSKDSETTSSKQPRTSMDSSHPSTHLVSASAASVQEDASSAKSATVKPKTKKLTFQEQVMLHMLNAFKPFTLKSLAEEMKSNEASINFVLLSLIDKGLVLQKDFTSAKGRVKTLFWANHNGKAKEVSVTVPDRSMDPAERERTQRRMQELQNQIAAVKNQHQQVLQTPSNQDLSQQLAAEELAWQELQQRRQQVQARIQNGAPVSSKNRCPVRLKQRINHLRREWLRRKILCTEFLEELMFGLETKMKNILSLIDIETDEQHGAVLPAVYKVP